MGCGLLDMNLNFDAQNSVNMEQSHAERASSSEAALLPSKRNRVIVNLIRETLNSSATN